MYIYIYIYMYMNYLCHIYHKNSVFILFLKFYDYYHIQSEILLYYIYPMTNMLAYP